MADAMIDETSGHCTHEEGNCGSPAAIPFFISFQVVGSFVFLNLVVAVILENFEKLANVDSNLVSTSDLEIFSEAWAIYDPDADNYIPVTDVPDLLLMVPKPLGVKGKPKRHAVKMCLLLRLETRDGEVAFQDLLKAIIDNNYLQSGADIEEFKEVVPGVIMPPLAIGGGAEKKVEEESKEKKVVPLDQIFGQQIFEQEETKKVLRDMMTRAKRRIDMRGGPADPSTYQQVYVDDGYTP